MLANCATTGSARGLGGDLGPEEERAGDDGVGLQLAIAAAVSAACTAAGSQTIRSHSRATSSGGVSTSKSRM